MAKTSALSVEYLKQYIERLERLEEEKTAMLADIRDVFAEAKGHGFDIKIMRQVLKQRKMDRAKREEEEALLEIYKRALGMVPDFEEEEGAYFVEEAI
jgi:uncharacterized protein (UPF0335 family)